MAVWTMATAAEEHNRAGLYGFPLENQQKVSKLWVAIDYVPLEQFLDGLDLIVRETGSLVHISMFDMSQHRTMAGKLCVCPRP